ncbi:MAG: outer membrane beta-barrel protein [Taibaiella sp.]|nr:outer membrane beta-barrel protein [Taibaiella sp.]
MKQFLLSVLLLGSAQVGFSQFSVGVQGGMTTSHTDATPDQSRYFYGANAAYNFTPYLSLRANLNAGQLEGGDEGAANVMHYTNNFFQGDLSVKIYPVGILQKAQQEKYLYYLSKIYGSVGIGLMKSQTQISYLPDQVALFEFMGNYSGTDMVIPVEFGIDIPLSKPFKAKGFYVNLFYRANYLNTDQMDGYQPKLSSNESKDTYTNFGAGISYRF